MCAKYKMPVYDAEQLEKDRKEREIKNLWMHSSVEHKKSHNNFNWDAVGWGFMILGLLVVLGGIIFALV